MSRYISPHQFEQVNRLSIIEVEKHPYLRKGQSFFNMLYKLFPNVADDITGTELDMYYKDENIENFKNSL